MQHAGPNAERGQQTDAADAQNHLLPQPHALVPAVQLRRQLAVGQRVVRNVGVEQQQGRPTDLRAPGTDTHTIAVERDVHHHPLPLSVDRRAQRQRLALHVAVAFSLPALRIEPLAEIAEAVEDPDADQRHAEIGGSLDVIAGQRPQSAGVNRQRLVQSELGGEVGDRSRAQHTAHGVSPGAAIAQVFLELVECQIDAALQRRLVGAAQELLGRQFRQERDGVVVSLAPQVRVEIAEDRDHLGLPGPPEVRRQLVQARSQ